jgi:ABC-2 type transport system permease protein
MTVAIAPQRSRHRSRLRLVLGQIGYQSVLLVRSPAGAFFAVVVPLMILVALQFLHGQQTIEGVRSAQFFTAAMAAFAVMNVGYITTITGTVIARDEGILKRLRGTPLPPVAYIAGRIGAAALMTAGSVTVVILVGFVIYGISLDGSLIGVTAVTVLVGILCFTTVGLAATVVVASTDVALPIAYGTLLPLCFISDVFIPSGGGPGWLTTAASILPVKHLADALESAFATPPGNATLNGGDLVVLAAWAAGAFIVSMLFFRWEPRPSGPGIRRRLAKLIHAAVRR